MAMILSLTLSLSLSFFMSFSLTIAPSLSHSFCSQDDFDVDQFVADCRKQVQLEEMREDLEMYYKLLKTAMVELINKDYADFVNLSTNLVSGNALPPFLTPFCYHISLSHVSLSVCLIF